MKQTLLFLCHRACGLLLSSKTRKLLKGCLLPGVTSQLITATNYVKQKAAFFKSLLYNNLCQISIKSRRHRLPNKFSLDTCFLIRNTCVIVQGAFSYYLFEHFSLEMLFFLLN